MTDPATGLPELPEGHFWRITRSAGDYLRVQIRRKLRLGSRVVAWSVVLKSKANPEEIVHAAGYAMRDLRQGKRWREYLGDYPPKTLNPSTEGENK